MAVQRPMADSHGVDVGLENTDLELDSNHRAHLTAIAKTTGLLADVSRADVLLYARDKAERAGVVAQARPHSVPPIHKPDIVGDLATSNEHSLVFRALNTGRYAHGQPEGPYGAVVAREVFPVEHGGRTIGALSIEKTLIEHERHQRRSRAFREAVHSFQWAASHHLVSCLDDMSPFGEHDGILVVDANRRIQYASGLANNLYRRLGAMDLLPGKRLSILRDSDDQLVARALETEQCLEEEAEEGAFLWVKKAVPFFRPAGWRRWLRWWGSAEPRLAGALFMIHDATQERRKEQILRLKEGMLEELQHRVKNSIQTIISLLRMQARRAETEETRNVLEDSITRLLSVAAVHDFLYNPGERIVDLRALTERILHETAKGIVAPGKAIELELDGPVVYLPANQATPCALVINELLLNALKHGYADQSDGKVSITLKETIENIMIEIRDDGSGLPENFDAQMDSSLGLSIVRTLVEDGLAGHFELRNHGGVAAIITFPKSPIGDESWTELES